MRNSLFAAIMLLLVPTMTAQAEEGDAAAGLKIAKDRCARCHDVVAGGAFKLMPPSFQAIAIYRGQMDIWGRIVAPSPHTGMPGMQWSLTPDDVQDVLAYVLSLDRPVSFTP